MKVFAVTPLHDNRVHYLYMSGLLQAVVKFGIKDFGAGFRSGSFLPHLRDILTVDFLASKADFMLSVDSDMAWSVKHLEMLLEHDREFVSGVYTRKQPYKDVGDLTVCYDGGEENRRGTLRKALSVGGGFMLVRRDAVEKMVASYPESVYPGDGTDIKNGAVFGLWNPISLGEHKKYLGEDSSFCHRWRAIGGTIWVDERVKVGHVGEHVYSVPPTVGLKPATDTEIKS